MSALIDSKTSKQEIINIEYKSLFAIQGEKALYGRQGQFWQIPKNLFFVA